MEPNTSAEITLKWADGRYTFALKFKQVVELERKCDAGLGLIVERMMRAQFRLSDISETIRLGLIGGGTTDIRALELVETYIEGKALMRPGGDGVSEPGSPYRVAQAILQAAYFGVPELEKLMPKEKGGGSKKKTEGSTPESATG